MKKPTLATWRKVPAFHHPRQSARQVNEAWMDHLNGSGGFEPLNFWVDFFFFFFATDKLLYLTLSHGV